MRVALYARHSDSELQNIKSSLDQLALLQRSCEARGWSLMLIYTDEGISGASIANRPGLQALLRDAARNTFDLVLGEALDRISRDQEGTAHVFKRLSFHGVVLETLAEGRISELHVGLSGTMNQLFLAELARKTRRGLIAKVEDGFSGGGLCYGYSIVAKGVFAIDEEQAEVIRRIFRDYAGGASARAIAAVLNAEGVPGPRGGEWAGSTIAGDRRTGDGILHQELYIGVRIFNRRKYRKHPDTGRRSATINPVSEWRRKSVPKLRIVDDELWERVQARNKALSEQPAAHARRPHRLLSGLLHCTCGGRMVLSGNRYMCSRRKERGTCSNGKVIKAETVEARVLEGVRTKLLAPDAIRQAVAAIGDAMLTEQRASQAERTPLEQELVQIERRLQRAQRMCLEEAISTTELKDLSAPLKQRQGEIQARLAQTARNHRPRPIVAAAASAYAAMAENLHLALAEAGGEAIRDQARELIERVDFIPLEGLGRFDLQVHGKLAALLGVSEEAANGCGRSVGAGTGFEPVTFRL